MNQPRFARFYISVYGTDLFSLDVPPQEGYKLRLVNGEKHALLAGYNTRHTIR